VVAALLWSFAIPALQGPDEVGHFSYTQRVWEEPSIPWQPKGKREPNRPSVSSELTTAGIWAGLEMLAGNVAARPLWTEPDEEIYEAAAARLRPGSRTDAGFTSALRNPPLYYLYSTPAYAVASGSSIFDRVLLLRLVNLPLLVALIVLTWLLAGELLGRRPWLRFTAAAPVALHPQAVNLTATHNPDLMLAAGWALALWLIVLVVRRGAEPRLVGALALAVAAIFLTHPRGLPIVLPAATAVAIGWRRREGRAAPWRAAVVGMLAMALAAVTAAAAWGAGSAREFWSYVWQFYLPRTPGQQDPIGPDSWDFAEVFVDRFYGTVAHLEVVFPPGLLTALLWASLAGLAAFAAALIARRESLQALAPAAGVLALAVIALVLGSHLGAYRAMLTAPGDPVFTGRYLLPLLPLYGIAIATVVAALPRRVGIPVAGALLGGVAVLQLVGTGLVLERFYG